MPSIEECSDEATEPPTWYPGWRRVQRLKDKWLREGGRLTDFDPSKSQPDCWILQVKEMPYDGRHGFEAFGFDSDGNSICSSSDGGSDDE